MLACVKLCEEEQKGVAWLKDCTPTTVHDARDTCSISTVHARYLYASAPHSRLQFRHVPKRLHSPVSPLFDKSLRSGRAGLTTGCWQASWTDLIQVPRSLLFSPSLLTLPLSALCSHLLMFASKVCRFDHWLLPGIVWISLLQMLRR